MFLGDEMATQSASHLKIEHDHETGPNLGSLQIGYGGEEDDEDLNGFWMFNQYGYYVMDPFEPEEPIDSILDPYLFCYLLDPEKTVEYLKKTKPPGWHKYVGKTLGLF